MTLNELKNYCQDLKKKWIGSLALHHNPSKETEKVLRIGSNRGSKLAYPEYKSRPSLENFSQVPGEIIPQGQLRTLVTLVLFVAKQTKRESVGILFRNPMGDGYTISSRAESFVVTFLSSFDRLISRRNKKVLGRVLVLNGD
jgi:hypothetical protein